MDVPAFKTNVKTLLAFLGSIYENKLSSAYFRWAVMGCSILHILLYVYYVLKNGIAVMHE